MDSITNNKIKIHVKCGKKDLSDWPVIKRKYGTSNIISGTQRATLKTWKPVENQTEYTFQIRPEKAELDKNSTQTIDDIGKFQALLVRASDDVCYFRCRINNLDKDAKYKIRNMIWTECKKRYDLPTNPIEIRMPYFDQLDAREIRGRIVVAINNKTWPIEIKQWYIRNTKIITEGNKSIDNILSNVMKPQHTQGPCVCERVHLR